MERGLERAIRPVLVGAGGVTDHPEDPVQGQEPLVLMEEAARRAADDAGGGEAILAALDTVAVVNIVSHQYGDPATMLAERLGATSARVLYTTMGGNTPGSLLNHLCDEIAAGRSEMALLAGAEAFQTVRALSRAGRRPAWPSRTSEQTLWGDARVGWGDLEVRHAAHPPVASFPLFENAFRAARGLSLAAHRDEMAAFCARCARVAAGNPHAWFRDAKDAATIATVTPANRMVGFPYPKFMNAMLEVNQGGALLLMSDAAADRLGIAGERRVYPWAGVDVTEHWYLLDKVDYHSLPGVTRAGRSLFEAAGVGLEQIDHVDLYSCFPIAPRLTAAALGLAPDHPRTLTVAGGLPWFGGPGSNYVTHAVAAVMARLREAPGGFGLTHGLGWNLTKHALTVFSTTPPPRGWQRAGGPGLQAAVDALPHPPVALEPSGPATIETYTVLHGRDGEPERGVVVGRLGDGQRFLAVLPRDRTVLEAMERSERIGSTGTARPRGEINLFDPS